MNFPLEIAAVLAFASVLFSTGEALSYTADGHTYELSCNNSGYVLTSKYPVTRTVGQGAGSRFIEATETIYLGKSCDAFTQFFGSGQWCWANGGFLAEFTEHRFAFGRQELYCPQGNIDFGTNCRC